MKYRIVQMVEGRMVQTEPTDIFAWAEVAGFEVMGLNTNKRHRAELQGQPLFSKLCGPMWDGDAVRYECTESNDRLSA